MMSALSSLNFETCGEKKQLRKNFETWGNTENNTLIQQQCRSYTPGIILGMGSANERGYYIVTIPLMLSLLNFLILCKWYDLIQFTQLILGLCPANERCRYTHWLGTSLESALIYRPLSVIPISSFIWANPINWLPKTGGLHAGGLFMLIKLGQHDVALVIHLGNDYFCQTCSYSRPWNRYF